MNTRKSYNPEHLRHDERLGRVLDIAKRNSCVPIRPFIAKSCLNFSLSKNRFDSERVFAVEVDFVGNGALETTRTEQEDCFNLKVRF